eukprot:Sspe_Gene.108872::Locus_88054_Transcript_1_1_Confidence_1.000_Length_1072::g.108872::m.108872
MAATLTPRPPPCELRGRPGPRPVEGQRRLHSLASAVGDGSAVDWDAVRSITAEAGTAQPATAYYCLARDFEERGKKFDVEGIEFVNGIPEQEVLAEFYDQNDASEILEDMLRGVPREQLGVRTLEELDRTSAKLRSERSACRTEGTRAQQQFKQAEEEAASKEVAEVCRSLAVAFDRIDGIAHSLEDTFSQRTAEIRKRREWTEGEEIAKQNTRLRQRLEAELAESHLQRRRASERIEGESNIANLVLQEFMARRSVEQDESTAYVGMRWKEIQSTEQVRFQEEEAEVRGRVAAAMEVSSDTHLRPVAARLAERVARQRRIAELESQLRK